MVGGCRVCSQRYDGLYNVRRGQTLAKCGHDRTPILQKGLTESGRGVHPIIVGFGIWPLQMCATPLGMQRSAPRLA